MRNRAREIQATRLAMTVGPMLEQLGVDPGTHGFDRLMYNVIDFAGDAPQLVDRFVQQLPQVVKDGATIERIAQARAESFRDESTNTWRFNRKAFRGYRDLLLDQRKRAGAYDYGKALN